MLQGVLPPPKHAYALPTAAAHSLALTTAHPHSAQQMALQQAQQAEKARSDALNAKVPRYLQRQGYIPREVADFGDGGAFPELHLVQYPLNMGRPGAKTSAVVAVDVDEAGNVRFDAIVKQGLNAGSKGGNDLALQRKVYTSLDDMKEKTSKEDAVALPSQEELEETANKTRMLLEKKIEGKIKKAQPTQVNALMEKNAPEYIQYTANPNAPGYNPSASNRVIRMVEAQVDPMEPPKHKHKKVPRGPPSPPPPVLHSPPRKLTAQDQQAWKIPPCISNWKNARGYTIPLDKRLAADGRGLQEVTINNKFAMLAESLYVAERKAGEELKIRQQIRQQMSIREKEEKEEQLRDLAARAREERAGVLDGRGAETSRDEGSARDVADREEEPAGARYESGSEPESEEESSRRRGRRRSRSAERSDRSDSEDAYRGGARRGSDAGETEEERIARIQREKLRIERRKENESRMRMDNMKGNFKRTKLDRDQERDVSEKIALGMHRGTGKLTGEAMYDARLFNQSAGMDSGFGREDDYSVYSKPLFDRQEATSMYRPKRNADDEMTGETAEDEMKRLRDTSRFKPDKGFKGTEGGASAGPRTEPVQFERGNKKDEDVFGIDALLNKQQRS